MKKKHIYRLFIFFTVFISQINAGRMPPPDGQSLPFVKTIPRYQQMTLREIPAGRMDPELKFSRYSIEDGLSDNNITVIVQDSSGFVWIGTQNGLNRFDGYTFTVFKNDPGNQDSISHNHISDIIEDNEKNLWIATKGGGINRFNQTNETFTRIRFENGQTGQAGMTFFNCFEDSKGYLWFTGMGETGIIKYDKKQGTSKRYDPGKAQKGPNTFLAVWDIYEDDDGTLWMAAESALLSFDPVKETFRFYKLPAEENRLSRIFTDDKNRMWLTGFKGIYLYDRSGDKISFIKEIHAETSIIDSKGNFWLGSHNGLHRFDRDSLDFDRNFSHDPYIPFSISHNQVMTLFEDRGGTIWAGTKNGLNLFHQRTLIFELYHTIQEEEKSSYLKDLRTLDMDSSGAAWFISGSTLWKMDKHNALTGYVLPFEKNKKAANVVTSLFCDSRDFIWIAGSMGTLTIFNSKTGEAKSCQPIMQMIDTKGRPPMEITSIKEDKQGNIWFSVLRAGLLKYERASGEFQCYLRRMGPPAGNNRPKKSKELQTDSLTTLFIDREGLVWLGSEGGIVSFYNPETKLFSNFYHDPLEPNTISRGVMSVIHQDKTGAVWIGTTDGLNRFDPEKRQVRMYSKQNGLAGNYITAVLEDEEGFLWLSSKQGITKFDPKSEKSINFSKENGLQGNGFNKAACKNSMGKMFFAGENGITAFFPGSVSEYPYKPAVVVTGMFLFHKEVKAGDENDILSGPIHLADTITLNHKQNVISFEFSALSFFASSKNRYQYKLEGLEPGWNEVDSTRRLAMYTDLDPGTYIFKVKGANSSGVFADSEALLKIRVKPPWWKTWWAYSLYILLITITLFLIVYNRLKQQKIKLLQKEKELEHERAVSEKLKRLDTLKDEFLANTSHELRTPLNGIIGLAESLTLGAAGKPTKSMVSNLEMIISSGKRLAYLVNDLLDFSKLRNRDLTLSLKTVDIRSVTDVVITLLSPLLLAKDLKLINGIPEDVGFVTGDENRIQQILYNLVGNAIKFTETGSVTVSAEVVFSTAKTSVGKDSAETKNPALDLVAVTVSDTGIGICKKDLGRIFESFEQADGGTSRTYGGTGLGLSLTKQLVELQGGTIRVESEFNKGARFTFTLPKADNETGQAPESEGETLSKIDITAEKSGTPADMTGQADKKRGSDFHILIVDDEPVNLQVLENHLKVEGYDVSRASSGEEALNIITSCLVKKEKIDLVVLDIMMPRMSGYEVARKLREKYPPYQLPIVMLTAKNRVSDLINGFNNGANDYLIKPFSREELLVRIKNHLNFCTTTRSFGRFVPLEYLDFLHKESINDIHLGDHVAKEMAVMFSDIRTFTTISESMTSQENFNFINSYLTKVSPCIRLQNGFIVKFLGDGMMAVFPDTADDAVRAAVHKLSVLHDYNKVREEGGRIKIQVGIGIHYGPMMVGMVGEENRMQGDAFSDTVNLTARIEGLTKLYGSSILISGETLNQLQAKEQYLIRYLDKVIVKGRNTPIDIYEVLEQELTPHFEHYTRTLTGFAGAVKNYQSGQFARAVEGFKEVLQQNPADAAAEEFVSRLAKMETEGYPADWDGISRMSLK